MFFHVASTSTPGTSSLDALVYPDHKLCGYFITAVSLSSLPFGGLPFLTPCLLSYSPNEPDFDAQSPSGAQPCVVSLPIDLERYRSSARTDSVYSSTRTRKKRRVNGIGIACGNSSSVFQIATLVSHKCVKSYARVLGVDSRGVDLRVVILQDVYLPVAAWSGWQFPKYGRVAGSLFQHLSCDWKARLALLSGGGALECLYDVYGINCVWRIPYCHSIGCKLHCIDEVESCKRNRFDLPGIFRSISSVDRRGKYESSGVMAEDGVCESGIWDAPDDTLLHVLGFLEPRDLIRVASTCRHLRSLAMLVIPCMKLKLFPHQRAAVEWMLQRERNVDNFPHPLFESFLTQDGFPLHMNTISGEISTGSLIPMVRDFRGGMFCDEPGLGKTITALSLILKTQGRIANPPDGVEVCSLKQCRRYYDLNSCKIKSRKSLAKQGARRNCDQIDGIVVDDDRPSLPFEPIVVNDLKKSSPYDERAQHSMHCVRRLHLVRRNLFHGHDATSGAVKTYGLKRTTRISDDEADEQTKRSKVKASYSTHYQTWIQCDACKKWRRIKESVPGSSALWFCNMNSDSSHQDCMIPEESWSKNELITSLPGFYTKGTSWGKEQNVSHFVGILKEHYPGINQNSKKALNWLADLSNERLSEMESVGLVSPVLGSCSAYNGGDVYGFHKIFQAIGFRRVMEKGISRWYYPKNIDNLEFDLAAFRIALDEPLDSVRMYLSGATLIVVPSNLVEHWKTQILKHVKAHQLRVCFWTEHRTLRAHILAWEYDIVITTFNRLSAEWGPHKKSPLMNVHWLRIILDEGHTLGSSLTLTNKLQMATSLVASTRWLLTGTPMPNTPDSQLIHLHPMLKFLHEEVYGGNQNSWEAGILRPFEEEMEEGRIRLLRLLDRCLISARKQDLKTIPPCIRKVTLLNFTKDNARSYNELVATVKRNILLADWNDPSHIESLLNPKQWKFRSATLRNVRLSCCVAGHIRVSEVGDDIKETMDVLEGEGLDPMSEDYLLIKYALQHGGCCLKCKEWCRLPFITPCRHILCIACIALDSEKCTFPGCNFSYEMQTPRVRVENPNPKWPVPKDLIELQPSYKQDDWDPDWQSTTSSKIAYLVQSLKHLQGCRDKPFDSFQEASFTINCYQLHENTPANEKVIIFSQFLEHIHVIEQQLKFAGIKFVGLYSPMQSTSKIKSLESFRHDPACMAIIMDGSAALGLDLSFVSYVYLMEPIWDRSVEEQMISRAHRMGATRTIHVETLAMRGTIEEQMVAYLQEARPSSKDLKDHSSSSNREGQRRKLHDIAENNYLSKLAFVHTSTSTL